MAVNVINIKDYDPKGMDVFFFDNNIWMLLFCPLGHYNINRQKAYSSFLKNVETANSSVVINSLVLSEFANRYLRMDFEQWKDEEENYKAKFKENFVGSNRYSETAEEIKSQIHKILNVCDRFSDEFNSINLEAILDQLQNIDFNDSYYIELAKQKNWKIVTDDGDFQKIDDQIEVLTANL